MARWDMGRQRRGQEQDVGVGRSGGPGCGESTGRVTLTLLSLPPANQQTVGQLQWQNKVANALLANGVQLIDNQLEVPSDGLYLIYSQVLFKGQDCPQAQLLLTHTIRRFAVSYPDKVNLLSAIKSPCQRETPEGMEAKPWYEPIYLGGVFQLEKGDRLSAEINLPDYLDFADSGQVYFGLIAL